MINGMKRKNSNGFTLIEMAIVLVIIGLILGAVTKGRDVVNSAKQKNFLSYLNKWELAAIAYYDQTGNTVYTINGTSPSYANVETEMDKYKIELPQQTFHYSGKVTARDISPLYRTNTTYGDYLYLQNIPTDLALALDVMIDGSADGQTGQFLNNNAAVWPDDISSPSYVTAIYKLNLP